MANTQFQEWIDNNVDVFDIVEMWQLYQAVLREREYFPFQCLRNDNNDKLFLKNISNNDKENTLMITSALAKETFLKILNSYYSKEGGIELAYAVDKMNEKD